MGNLFFYFIILFYCDDDDDYYYSIQIWPKDKAIIMKVGTARTDPNQDPYCPPPTGRLQFSWNPFYMYVIFYLLPFLFCFIHFFYFIHFIC